jgi:hypothetical protein
MGLIPLARTTLWASISYAPTNQRVIAETGRFPKGSVPLTAMRLPWFSRRRFPCRVKVPFLLCEASHSNSSFTFPFVIRTSQRQ